MTRGLGGVLTLPSRGHTPGGGHRSDLLPIYLGALGVFFSCFSLVALRFDGLSILFPEKFKNLAHQKGVFIVEKNLIIDNEHICPDNTLSFGSRIR
jgi:hypothetical protein